MSNIPALTKQQVAFRSPTSSEAYNKQLDDSFFDVVNLYNNLNTYTNQLNTLRDIYTIQSQFQDMRIKDLEDKTRILQDKIDLLNGLNSSITSRAFVEDLTVDSIAEASERAEIDMFHRVVTLPIVRRTSKVYLYDEDYDQIIIPSTLGVTLNPAASDGFIVDTDLLNAFDGINSNYWMRKVLISPNDTTSKATVQVEITLPDNIISNRDVNTIIIHPFPLNSLDITEVKYKLDGGWITVPGFEPIIKAGNIELCFASLKIAKVRVTMVQNTAHSENGKKVFYLGAEEIGIYHTEYGVKGSFRASFNLDGKEGLKTITEIKPIFSNTKALNANLDMRNLFTYNLYTVSNGEFQYTKDSLPIPTTETKVVLDGMILLDPNNQATPALESVELVYK